MIFHYVKFIICCLLCFATVFNLAAQKTKVVNIGTNGTINTFNNIKKYNAVKDRILNLNKYIDTSKEIQIVTGSLTSSYSYDFLRDGKDVYPITSSDTKLLSLRLVKGKLKISANIIGFDSKYIAKIVDNKLETSQSAFRIRTTDRYFEIFDEYDTPVLQVEILKKTNQIVIQGLLVFDSGYILVYNRGGLTARSFGKPLHLMGSDEIKASAYPVRVAAKQNIKPISE